MAALALLFAICSVVVAATNGATREFKIDYQNDQFVKDGKPFQIISGSIHYYNVPYKYWQDRLRSMKDCGVNTLQTYVEWRSHEPFNGVFDFEAQNDLVNYIKLAQNEGLLVNIRLGPYIDSERDMGGLPWWLLQAKPDMKLRTNDADYIKFVTRFWTKIFSLIKPLLYSNGGPIVLVQLENEFGSFSSCDFVYTSYLRDLALQQLGNDVIYYTTDGGGDGYLKCGKNAGLFATVDFGAGGDISGPFDAQRRHQRHGPLVNSEYYTGWLDIWGKPHATVNTDTVVKTLDEMLSRNASVNMYMFHGGTHFGFDNGAELYGTSFQICPTSYDYDAPLTEAGDPTDKYFAIKNVIKKYAPVPDANPTVKPKLAFGDVKLQKSMGLKPLLAVLKMVNDPKVTPNPQTFEELNHPYGLVAYTTTISFRPTQPAVLAVPGLRDRGYVFVDNEFQGLISREVNVYNLPILARENSTLTILVENQGRVCYGDGIHDLKGIIDKVTLGTETLTNWLSVPLPDKANGDLGFDLIGLLAKDHRRNTKDFSDLKDTKYFGIYEGQKVIDENSYPILLDSYLRLDGWTKGFVLINDVNVGRYWPVQGPQVTLYVPSVYLNFGVNKITVVELESAPGNVTITFTDKAYINGPVPKQ